MRDATSPENLMELQREVIAMFHPVDRTEMCTSPLADTAIIVNRDSYLNNFHSISDFFGVFISMLVTLPLAMCSVFY